MNKREEFNRMRKTKDKISINHRHRNAIKISKTEGILHRGCKVVASNWAVDNDEEYYTEAVWTNGSGRADFVISRWPLALEFVDSESSESIERKSREYPVPVLEINVRDMDKIHDILDDLANTEGRAYHIYKKRKD